MFMFLTILFASFAAIAVGALIVASGSPRQAEAISLQPERSENLGTSKFFGADAQAPALRQPVPVEVLMSQIEKHVRLEQAAAQSFLDVPTSESLHSRTESPFVN